jgi:hypothetical protein
MNLEFTKPTADSSCQNFTKHRNTPEVGNCHSHRFL